MMNERQIRQYKATLENEVEYNRIKRSAALNREDQEALDVYNDIVFEKGVQVDVLRIILEDQEVSHDSTINKK